MPDIKIKDIYGDKLTVSEVRENGSIVLSASERGLTQAEGRDTEAVLILSNKSRKKLRKALKR